MKQLILFILMLPIIAQAQQATVKGIIKNDRGLPMAGVSVRIEKYGIGTSSNEEGLYELGPLKAGNYTIVFSTVGFSAQSKAVQIGTTTSVLQLPITFNSHTNQLNEVTVASKTNAAVVRESPQTVSVINAKAYYNRSSGLAELINQTAGLKVRQDGGMGSEANYYLNGISGKQVKFFINGIPLDLLGSGMNINILPINGIDRVEIYKGVVPVQLGADALGGAINIITRKSLANYIDASYAISSFNTHKASINLQRNIGSNLFVNAMGYYNYSDNNYKIDTYIPNASGNPIPAQVRRFHDRYKNYYGSAEIGVKNKKWVDFLSITSALSGVDQQIQNNVTMTQPFGHVNSNSNSWNNALKYIKKNLLPNFDIDLYAGIDRTHGQLIDTSLYTYNWDGNIARGFDGKPVRRSYNGETFGPLRNLRTTDTKSIARLGLHYTIDQQSALSANFSTSYFKRKEDDPESADYPIALARNTFGLAYERTFFNQQLTSITSIKHFRYTANGYDIDRRSGIRTTANIQKQQTGWNEALKWQFNPALLAKASYEYASRLPDEDELFGNYALIVPNPNLVPETGHNFNLGLQYNKKKFMLEVSTFYRLVDNMIYLKPSTQTSWYQNLLKAQISGIEASINYMIVPSLNLNLNATYQDIRDKSKLGNSGAIDNRYYNQRQPNMPYLFANAELQYNKKDLIQKNDRFSIWYNLNYVESYYLASERDGDAAGKAIIPTQYVHNAGINYSLINNRYNIGFEVQNFTDAHVYDNYKVQRPGRSFHLKLRTFIQ